MARSDRPPNEQIFLNVPKRDWFGAAKLLLRSFQKKAIPPKFGRRLLESAPLWGITAACHGTDVLS